MSFCVQSPESWWRIQSSLQVRHVTHALSWCGASDSVCTDLLLFSLNINACFSVRFNIPLPHRWIFLWAWVHRELDQREEQDQPHDQPASTNHTPHPQQVSEDGYNKVEVEPVNCSSFLSCLSETTKQVFNHYTAIQRLIESALITTERCNYYNAVLLNEPFGVRFDKKLMHAGRGIFGRSDINVFPTSGTVGLRWNHESCCKL